MMNVEVGGKIVRRPGVLEVLLYDRTGKPTVSRMRPQLLPGEALYDRDGMIPAIVKESEMKARNDVWRHQVIRAVLGTHPAMLAKEADPVALDCLCRRLADAQDAAALLVANGCGWPARTLTDMVRTALGIQP
jgi:hypothetical protein